MRSASRLQITAAILATLVVGALLPATASANHNDDFADAAPLNRNTLVSDNNVGTSIEPPEAFTRTGSLCEGQAMGGTLWWKFVGNGQPVTVSTRGSVVTDTLLGVWANGTTLSACSDDVASDKRWSEVRINTVNGTTYWVQAGSLCLGFDGAGDCDDWNEGNLSVAAWTLPGNDSRGGAIDIHHHHLISSETRGAREDGGEITQCRTSPFGKTTWYRFVAPSKGDAHFNVTGFDTVVAVYDGDSPNFIDCYDDPTKTTGSHLDVRNQCRAHLLPAGRGLWHRPERGRRKRRDNRRVQ